MNIEKIREQAFQRISENTELWQRWNNAETPEERALMMYEQVYAIAYVTGVIRCEAIQSN